jgi:uncharacterized protein (DUF736 family)
MEISNFSIFKNRNKTKENHPDWNITAKNEDGEFKPVGACWTKVSKSGDKYLSCVLEKREEAKPETKPADDGIEWD